MPKVVFLNKWRKRTIGELVKQIHLEKGHGNGDV